MARVHKSEKLLLVAEAAEAAGISKATLLRWIKQEKIKDAARRDRNDWRLFSEAEVDAIVRLAQREKNRGA